MTFRRALQLCLLPLAISLTACGGDDSSSSGSLSESDASAGWAATETALDHQSQNIIAKHLEKLAQSVSDVQTCNGGGTVSFDVNVSAGTLTSVAYDAAFDGCTEDGITIDGTVTFATESGASGVTVDYTGDLTYSGDVEGGCVIDVSIVTSTTTVPPSVSVTGSICGYDGSVVVNG